MTETKAKYYWKIKTKNESIWIHADEVGFNDTGCAIFYKDDDKVLFAIREWEYIGAASVFDGSLVYIEHWDKISENSNEQI